VAILNNSMLGQFFVFKNGTIGRVNDSITRLGVVYYKLRCIRIGTDKYGVKYHPYTYQRYIKSKNLKKGKRIGTEEILNILL
jgi:hypothetical protein